MPSLFCLYNMLYIIQRKVTQMFSSNYLIGAKFKCDILVTGVSYGIGLP